MFDPIEKKVTTDENGKFETTVTITGGPGISKVAVSATGPGIAAGGTASATAANTTTTPPVEEYDCSRPLMTITFGPYGGQLYYDCRFTYSDGNAGNSTSFAQVGVNEKRFSNLSCEEQILVIINQSISESMEVDIEIEGYYFDRSWLAANVRIWRFYPHGTMQ